MAAQEQIRGSGAVARVFLERPDRLAAAWRRLRRDAGGENVLEDVVESFIREVGASLQGVQGAAWSRTTGVLRLSQHRGRSSLEQEFHMLQRCLIAAGEVLGGSARDRAVIVSAIEEARESALATYRQLFESGSEPSVHFGGLIVERYEQPSARVADGASGALLPTVH
jgi:hypothetical protein